MVISLLSKHVYLSSLFVKPKGFENENEIRLVFEMRKDVKRKRRVLDIHNEGLLDYVEVIN